MTGFCTEKIVLQENMRAVHGVLRSEELIITNSARFAAGKIISDSKSAAEITLLQAKEKAKSVATDAEMTVFLTAEKLLKSIEESHDQLLHQAQDIIVDVAIELFDRLMMEIAPRERLEASLRRIAKEAPPKLVQAVLYVHPDEKHLLPTLDWECKDDRSLSLGSCRLEASNGEWCADFTAAIASLKTALILSARKFDIMPTREMLE